MNGAPDRLSTIAALVLAAGILILAWLVVDAIRPRPPALVTRAALPEACPAPQPGEKLLLYVESSGGKLNIKCDTLRPYAPVKAPK